MSPPSSSAARPSYTLQAVILLVVSTLGLIHARPTPFGLRSRADKSVDASSTNSDTYSTSATKVAFTTCEGESLGNVTSMFISPCQRSSDSEPCVFEHGRNYTISLGFVSHLNSSMPRSSVVAQDGKDSYAYSGQSFNACKYAPCPIVAEKPSTYIYKFDTLASAFDHLSFNVTDGFEGPSLFCAGVDINFKP